MNSRENIKLQKGNVKPFLTIEEQLDLLISRGLIVDDRENALNILSRTNYYRLSAYSLTLRKDNVFYEGVSFDDIYELYRFDDCFRKIVFQYSQYVEIALRTYIAYNHAEKYGPLGYLDNKCFDNQLYHLDFITKLEEEISRSDDVFVYHYKNDMQSVFPIWVALECCSFGNLSKLFKNLKSEDRTDISKKKFGVNREYVENWLQAAVVARNIAAHGGRFYNRKFRSVPVKIDKKYKGIIDGKSPFAYIFAIYKMLPTVELAKSMLRELENAFNTYEFAQNHHMGFPSNWKEILVKETNRKAYQYRKEETE